MTKETTPAGNAAAVPQENEVTMGMVSSVERAGINWNWLCERFGLSYAVKFANGLGAIPPASLQVEAAQAPSELSDAPDEFERWLRCVCFQKPTPEAYDLAKDAWKEASRTPADTQDADRYRLLRSCRGQEHDLPFTVVHDSDGLLWGGDLDAAIDAARQEGKGGAS